MARHGHRHHHHHHHRPNHHRHHVNHHHHHRANRGVYPGMGASPGTAAAGCYFVCCMLLATFGGFCLLSGTVMMATGYGDFYNGVGVAGTVFFVIGVGLVTGCCVLCYFARKKQQESTVVDQQVAAGTTLTYGPGGEPISSQTAPPGVTIVYGPGVVQPQPQGGFQPQQYPNQPAIAPYPPVQAGVPYAPQPAAPYPPQPGSEISGQPASPPPSYDDVVKTETVAVNIDEPAK